MLSGAVAFSTLAQSAVESAAQPALIFATPPRTRSRTRTPSSVRPVPLLSRSESCTLYALGAGSAVPSMFKISTLHLPPLRRARRFWLLAMTLSSSSSPM